MEFLQLVQTMGAIAALSVIVAGSQWLKTYLWRLAAK